MVFLLRGCPLKKLLFYGLYLVANSHNYIQVWVNSEGHRQSFIEECIVLGYCQLFLLLTCLYKIIVNIICGVVTMSNLYIPE